MKTRIVWIIGLILLGALCLSMRTQKPQGGPPAAVLAQTNEEVPKAILATVRASLLQEMDAQGIRKDLDLNLEIMARKVDGKIFVGLGCEVRDSRAKFLGAVTMGRIFQVHPASDDPAWAEAAKVVAWRIKVLLSEGGEERI